MYYIIAWCLQNTVILPLKFIFRLFAGFKISGLENLEKIERNAIFATNHLSDLDAELVPVSLPFLSKFVPMHYVSMEKKYYKLSSYIKRKFLYGGIFFKCWGAFPAKLEVGNYEESLKIHLRLLQEKKSLCIFPEGKKSLDGKFGRAKGGVAFLAHQTKVLIVPVFIKGTYKITLKDFFLGRKEISLTYGKPIFFEDLFKEKEEVDIQDYKTISQKILDEVEKLSKA